MPPYLQHELGTMDSVLAFLKKVQDVIGQFSDPFQLEDILAYIDSLSAGDSAAKTAVDIALHDLVGKLLQALGIRYGGWTRRRLPLQLSPSVLIRPTWCVKRRKSVPTGSISLK